MGIINVDFEGFTSFFFVLHVNAYDIQVNIIVTVDMLLSQQLHVN